MKNSLTAVALVPIKLNSQRLQNKNIALFTDGEPLLTYVLNTLVKISSLDGVYVYCSQDRIQEYLPDGVTFLKRPEKLDGAQVKMNEVIASFMQEIKADVYLQTHATSPFVTERTFRKGLEAVITGKYDSAFSAEIVQDFFWKDGEPMNYSLSSIPRTQDLPILYRETSGMYVFKREIMQTYGRRIGTKPFLVEVPKIEAIDIDEMEDFIIADAVQYYLKRKECAPRYAG